jgi:hypothetical protein
MNKDLLNLKNLFLTDPKTGEGLFITSDLYDEGFGKTSFVVSNNDQTVFWKHTFSTEETERQ